MCECGFFFQPGVCNATVLCIVPTEEVSDLPSARRNLSKAVLWFTSYPVCCLFQLHVSQWLRAGAPGENPGQPPGSGESLLQQRAMSAAWTLPWHRRGPQLPVSQFSSTSFNVPKLSLSPCFFNQLLSLWLFLLWLLEIYSDWERWSGCPKSKWILLSVQYLTVDHVSPPKIRLWFFKYLCSPFAKFLISASHSWRDYIRVVNIWTPK